MIPPLLQEPEVGKSHAGYTITRRGVTGRPSPAHRTDSNGYVGFVIEGDDREVYWSRPNLGRLCAELDATAGGW